jgi:hypothetical protein
VSACMSQARCKTRRFDNTSPTSAREMSGESSRAAAAAGCVTGARGGSPWVRMLPAPSLDDILCPSVAIVIHKNTGAHCLSTMPNAQRSNRAAGTPGSVPRARGYGGFLRKHTAYSTYLDNNLMRTRNRKHYAGG